MSELDDLFEQPNTGGTATPLRSGFLSKNKMMVIVVPSIILLMIAGAVLWSMVTYPVVQVSQTPRNTPTPNMLTAALINSPVLGNLSEAEAKTLQWMREEEKLARDVYLEMHSRWGVKIFNSISRSEQRHMDAMAMMLQRYQIPDPVTHDRHGAFLNESLAKSYQTLIARGMKSMDEALVVGGLIEEMDIADLEEAIRTSLHPDLNQVYEALRQGSFNHLRAFVHGLELRGTNYQPVKMSPQALDTILHSPMETGPMWNGRPL